MSYPSPKIGITDVLGLGSPSARAFVAFVASAAALYAVGLPRDAFDESGNIRPFEPLTSGPDGVLAKHFLVLPTAVAAANEMKTGEFVKQKVQNMVRWERNELGDDVITESLQQAILCRSEVEIVYVLRTLKDHTADVHKRDWEGLANSATVPDEFKTLIVAIRDKPVMHDKFWRYLDMFSEVLAQDM
ncbi:MAG: hypothetical protein SGPRY_005593 [Prymnesium sp.]